MADDILERLSAKLSDRYAIERELGRGGMATVFLASDIKHDRRVAIKVLHPELSATIGAERFEREIKLAAKLQHPNILGLYDSGEADGLLFYVMPFVEGESLRDRLDRDGQLPIDDAIQYVLEVADALGYAHSQNIVHRDIKPENILVSNGHALVADFGIARAASEGGGQKLTQTGMAIGTPVYMAPEQSAGEKVGPTADIYSLGCLLYELLAGEPPFTGKNAMAIMARHAMETVPSIRIVRSTVPEEVEEAIFAAMAKTPTDRPQTAAQFAEILGVPLGTTTSRRAVMRHTATRRVPTAANQTYVAEPPAVPVWRRPLTIGIAVLAIGAGIGLWRFETWRGKGVATTGGLDPTHVAVLYFEDLSRDQSLGFLADGLTETLISTLGQVQVLSVVSKGGVQPYRDGTVTPDSIARALGTGTLVRGTIDREGTDRLRISVKLLDGNSGADFQTAGLTESATNFLAVRDSVAQEVARLIRGRLGKEIKLREQRQSTRNVEAWALLQRAEQFRKSGEAAAAKNDTATMGRDYRAADSLLAGVEALDRNWPDPIVMRSQIAYRRSRFPGLDPLAAKGWITEGLGHAERAVALDPDNPDALELRGTLHYWSWLLGLEPDKAKALALLNSAKTDLEKATLKNPAQAGAWATLSHLYYQTPDKTPVDVNLAARSALQADAFLSNADVILNRLFLSSYDLGQFPDAEHWCQELRRRFPAAIDALSCELFLLTTKARPPNPALAWALADSVTQRAPETSRAFQRLYGNMLAAIVLARAGQADSARHVIERSKGNEELDPTRDLTLVGAYGYVQLGDKEQAINLLKIYLSANERRRAGYADDPGWQLRALADDPRFRQLVTGS